ncbi:probable RNA polymerase II nuclear localization protein SLC7A6OS [Oscarella lobularis]|uniref:probable RNA polymerase II nuclear localization protein SLC7A6OS n=1 Tax=Oscarella lobularis TaxID=121494 RepID=UPI0033140DF9
MGDFKPLLRVKRRRWEDPAEAFLISAKRRRDDADKSDQAIFRFVATLEEGSEEAANTFVERRSQQLRSQLKLPQTSGIKKKRIEKRAEKQASASLKRYKIVSRQRDVEDDPSDASDLESEAKRLFQLYDIIEEEEDPKKDKKKETRRSEVLEALDPDALLCNSVAMIREKLNVACCIGDQDDSSFVYDLYYPVVDDAVIHLDRDVRIETLDGLECLYSDDEESQNAVDDEDDSNDESNWRNDYPEEENSESDVDEEERFQADSKHKTYEIWKKQTKRELGLTERFSDEDNEDCEEDELAFYSNREEYCYYDQS